MERGLNKCIYSYMVQMIQDYREMAIYCLQLLVTGSLTSWWGQSNQIAFQSPGMWIFSKTKETECFFFHTQWSTWFPALHQQKHLGEEFFKGHNTYAQQRHPFACFVSSVVCSLQLAVYALHKIQWHYCNFSFFQGNKRTLLLFTPSIHSYT